MHQHGLTNRAFGFTIAGGLLALGSIAWLAFDVFLRWVPGAAGVLALLALLRPGLLLPLDLVCRWIAWRIALLNSFPIGVPDECAA